MSLIAFRYFFACLFFLSTWPSDAFCQSKNLESWTDHLFKNATEKSGFSGVLLVAVRGDVKYKKAFGVQSLNPLVANSTATRFSIASLSKQFTAAAILKLEEDKKLSVEDKVCKYLKDFCRTPLEDITIHHLLTHTSGLGRLASRPIDILEFASLLYKPTALYSFTHFLPKIGLESPPGEKFLYSNLGYIMLSLVIENVTNENFATAMQKLVFGPAKLTSTQVSKESEKDSPLHANGTVVGKTSKEWWYQGFHLKKAEEFYPDVYAGAGSVESTVDDLLRWTELLKGTEFLSSVSTTKRFKPEKEDYSYGWFSKFPGSKLSFNWHNGALPGFSSELAFSSVHDQTFVLLSNQGDSSLTENIFADVLNMWTRN